MDDFNEDGPGTVFRDVTFLALGGFVAIVIILLPYINEVAKKSVMTTASALSVEVTWPGHLDLDVDTWIQAPGQPPVGYSAKNGVYASLLRDDRGHIQDTTQINYEVMFLRDLPNGEYVLNLHLYEVRDELPVECEVIVKKLTHGRSTVVIREVVKLYKRHQEVTVKRFIMNDGIMTHVNPTIFKAVRPGLSMGQGQ